VSAEHGAHGTYPHRVFFLLYINHLSATQSSFVYCGQTLDLDALPQPLRNDLSRLEREKTRDFDVFAGFDLYEAIMAYSKLLKRIMESVKPIKRLHSILQRTEDRLQKALEKSQMLYSVLKELIPLFDEIRAILGSGAIPKAEVRAAANTWITKLEAFVGSSADQTPVANLKYKRITAESSLNEIVLEWLRLYSTHESGLFHYLDIPELPRANVALEQMFSLESHHFRVASGYAQVGNMVQVRGGELCLVLQNYDPNIINRVLLTSDKTQVSQIIAQFRRQHQKQSEFWHWKKSKAPEILNLSQKIRELIPDL
jgi:hypothetical protein